MPNSSAKLRHLNRAVVVLLFSTLVIPLLVLGFLHGQAASYPLSGSVCLPIPQDSRCLGPDNGGELFQTERSPEDVRAFYERYTAGLRRVWSVGDADTAGYYDVARNIVFFGVTLSPTGGITRFTVAYAPYDETLWTPSGDS